MAAVSGMLTKTADVVKFGHLQVTTVTVRDISGILTLTWYNMPYLRGP